MKEKTTIILKENNKAVTNNWSSYPLLGEQSGRSSMMACKGMT